ncbi:hypothetical protein [Kineococcus rhizosphaerae]|uniref:Uncharacterized protein involved in tellurium resistance n=1 Tax=Kineococcus rhizosphaerae TaxID=559628 RepID=A0A2T0R8A1_9ACTN|nr:hypothetical protein [Kineococcus rhizosphaerae]PRY17403.1 uncharacterized protein involved in tellurium resistance [Kineococcus rhizosphaerae]
MSGTNGRPAEAVHNFLGRPGPRRSTRSLADHLNPPRPAPRPAPSPAPRPAPTPPAAPARVSAPPPEAVVGQARASERRVVLDDERPVLTIPAAERGGGTLRFTLAWEQIVTSSGLHRSSDVHLGCFWQTRDRRSGALQSLGELLAAPGFGARQVLRLGARSEQAGEEVLADAAHLDLLRRVVFYAYSQGSRPPDYARLAPHLSIARRAGGTVQLWTGEPPAGARTCALASIHDVGGDLVVRRENEFFEGPARDVALAYGFDDLDWNAEGTVPRPS